MNFGQFTFLPFRLLDKLNPFTFLRSRLLRNAPTMWRASLHRILWYLSIGFFGSFALGTYFALFFQEIPTLSGLLIFRTWVWPISIAFLVVWYTFVWNVPLIIRSPQNIAKTLLVYSFFAFGLILMPNAAIFQLSKATISHYDLGKYRVDKALTLSRTSDPCAWIKGVGYQDILATMEGLYVGSLDFEQKMRHASEALPYYESQCQPSEATKLMNVDQILDEAYVYFYRSKPSEPRSFRSSLLILSPEQGLVTRFEAVDMAAEFTGYKGFPIALSRFFQPVHIATSLLIACLLLGLEIRRERTAKLLRVWGLKLLPRKVNLSWLSLPRLDLLALRTYPRLWLIRPLFGSLSLVIIIFLAAHSLSSIETFRSQFAGGNWTVHAAIYCLFFIFLMSFQAKYLPMDRTSKNASAFSFLSLFLPIYTPIVVFFLMRDHPNSETFEAAGIIAAPLAYLAASYWWAVAISGHRIALVGVGTAALFGTMSLNYLMSRDIMTSAVLQLTGIYMSGLLLALLHVPQRFMKSSKVHSFSVVLVFLFAPAPLFLATSLHVMFEGYLEVHLTRGIAVVGFIPMILFLLPIFSAAQRRWIFPQE